MDKVALTQEVYVILSRHYLLIQLYYNNILTFLPSFSLVHSALTYSLLEGFGYTKDKDEDILESGHDTISRTTLMLPLLAKKKE